MWICVERDGLRKKFYKFEGPRWIVGLWEWGEGVMVRMVNPREQGLVCTICGCNSDPVVLCKLCKERRCRGQCNGRGLTLTERTHRWQRRYKQGKGDAAESAIPPVTQPAKQGWWATVKDIWKLLFCEPPELDIWKPDRTIPEVKTQTNYELPLYKKKPPPGPPEEFEV